MVLKLEIAQHIYSFFVLSLHAPLEHFVVLLLPPITCYTDARISLARNGAQEEPWLSLNIEASAWKWSMDVQVKCLSRLGSITSPEGVQRSRFFNVSLSEIEEQGYTWITRPTCPVLINRTWLHLLHFHQAHPRQQMNFSLCQWAQQARIYLHRRELDHLHSTMSQGRFDHSRSSYKGLTDFDRTED